MSEWTNDDGLRVKYGPDEFGPARVTEYSTLGPQRMVEILLDKAWLPAFGSSITLYDYVFPDNAEIARYEIGPSETDFTGTGATLTVSLVDKDGSSNAVTVASTLSLTALNTPKEVTDLDITLTAVKYVHLAVGTASYTAGQGKLRIYWQAPKKESDTLAWSKS